MVTVTSSSLMSDSQPLSSLCGRLSTRCVTKPHQKSWIQINNNPIQFPIPIVPLNNMSAPQQNMQLNANANNNWRLQGSLDGEQWTVIREHHNDESLRFKGQSYSWLLRNINSSNKKLSNNKNTLMESHKYIPPPLRSKILPNTTKLPLTNDKTLYNPSSDQERPHLTSTNTETHSNITHSSTYSNNIDDEDTDNNIECDPLSQEIPNNHNINDATENNNKKRDALNSKTLHSNPTRTETHVIITHSNVTQTTPLSPRTAESPFQASPTPNKKLSCSTSTSFPNANTISLDGNNNADKNININQTININASKIHRYLQFKTNTKFDDETNTQHSNLIHTETHLNNSHLTNTETRGDKIIHSNLIHRDPHSNTPHMTATVPNSNNQIIQNNYAIMRALPHCILTLTQNLYLLNGKNENIFNNTFISFLLTLIITPLISFHSQ
eukprot:550553_1